MEKPEIVCICGSSRFWKTWMAENVRLTDLGFIVLAIDLRHIIGKPPTRRRKEHLDWLHKRKIDIADWVWVLDVGGYIGQSTSSEIVYATKIGKLVRFLSSVFPDYEEPDLPLKIV